MEEEKKTTREEKHQSTFCLLNMLVKRKRYQTSDTFRKSTYISLKTEIVEKTKTCTRGVGMAGSRTEIERERERDNTKQQQQKSKRLINAQMQIEWNTPATCKYCCLSERVLVQEISGRLLDK